MLFDTHCHLNFEAFEGEVPDVLGRALDAQVNRVVVPGTDVFTSQKAVLLAQKYTEVYAAVGIHPHHIFDMLGEESLERQQIEIEKDIDEIKKLLREPKVVAVGEVGVDRHLYKKTKYDSYEVSEPFVILQKELLARQIQLAAEFEKSLILHNREAVEDLLHVLQTNWSSNLVGRTVIHCCEADERLLDFARKNNAFIGVDGDITWSKKKQRFIAEVPIELLVLETDSPYLTPEPAREQVAFPNEPKNITLVCNKVAEIKNISPEFVARVTTENAQALFNVQ